MASNISGMTKKRILKFQQDELTGAILYESVAKRQKLAENRDTLLKIADTERGHYEVWKTYTGTDVGPARVKLVFFKLACLILGYTFSIKLFEKMEQFGAAQLQYIINDIPEAATIIKDEEEHEKALIDMLDEERLRYIGAMVLGLNDALVELTGAIAGLTFALANTRLVALAAIITGVSATLSMAASNYLAQHADGNPNAVKSSVYTGVAYLITVILLVLPYLLIPNSHYILAFCIMIVTVIIIIMVFNFYISVAQSKAFLPQFGKMAVISLSVAAISFVIGLIAKTILGIDI